MKFTLLTTALLTLILTPLSVLADTCPSSPTATATAVILRKCVPLYSDDIGQAWHVADLSCNEDRQDAGYNGGACDRTAYQCLCS